MSNRRYCCVTQFNGIVYDLSVVDNQLCVGKYDSNQGKFVDVLPINDILDKALLQHFCSELSDELLSCQEFIKDQTGYFANELSGEENVRLG